MFWSVGSSEGMRGRRESGVAMGKMCGLKVWGDR